MRFDPGSWIKRRMEETRRQIRQQSFDIEFFLAPDLMELDSNIDFWFCVEVPA